MPALAAPTVWAAASPPRPARPCANGTLADLVAATPSLSLFARALAAVRYDDDLLPVLADRAATRTVFAPTNGAFMALAGTLGAAGPPGHEDAAWAAVLVPDATIVWADVSAANGVAHVVDRVLLPTAVGASLVLPPPASVTLAQLATVTPELSLVVSALNATGLLQLIANPAGVVTVLPPTNAAWVALAEALGYTSCGGCEGGDDDAAAAASADPPVAPVLPVVERACPTLRLLAFDAANRARILSAGGLATLTAAIPACAASASATEHALLALGNASFGCAAAKAAAAEAGAIYAVLATAAAHRYAAEVVEAAARVLRNLADGTERNRRLASEGGALKGAVWLLDAYPGEGGVVEQALAVLVNVVGSGLCGERLDVPAVGARVRALLEAYRGRRWVALQLQARMLLRVLSGEDPSSLLPPTTAAGAALGEVTKIYP
ncbi:hypothetical protein I4F81_005335 [Pyropia yezoensis]|uniref:Uncharacterized protein n=1 Tax=Pyropia yezoensis TaxID=2788 RepID=A0ACC3BYT5_PYRYE|nr:hypothetical protein I4F81_005335 [Neopyropia yezoensis]